MLLPIFAELVALVGGTVVTMQDAPAPVVPGAPGAVTAPWQAAVLADVLIEDGHVLAIGPELELPAGTRRVDVSGRWIVPGLVDGYVQFDADHDELYVAAGVTLVRDVGGDLDRLLPLREPQFRELVPGPALLSAGAVLAGEPPPSADAGVLADLEVAEAVLPQFLASGPDFLSVHTSLSLDVWRRTIELAHEAGLTVWGPVGGSMTFAGALAAGQDGFHFLDALLPPGTQWDFVQPPAFKRQIGQLVAADAGLVPVLGATASRLRLPDEAAAREDAYRWLGLHYESWWAEELAARSAVAAETAGFLDTGRRVVEKQQQVLGALDAAGARLIPGSASPHPWLVPGRALVDELELWEAAGIAPGKVLWYATRGACEALGVADRGVLAPGRVADLLVLAADPREAIANLRAPVAVMVRGSLLEAEDLAELRATVLAEQEFLRAAEATPMEVPVPDRPEGAVVLEGFVETRVRGRRTSAERYCVVREDDGALAFCGRLVTPPDGTYMGSDLNVIQRLRDGRLEEVLLVLRQEGHALTARGVWVAGKFHFERRFDGIFQDNRTTADRPLTIDVNSVTTPLVLGQLERVGRLPVLALHEGFEAEVVAWELQLREATVHLVATHRGGMGFGFEDDGSLGAWKVQVGERLSEMVTLETRDFGGAGMPLPESKRTDPATPDPVDGERTGGEQTKGGERGPDGGGR